MQKFRDYQREVFSKQTPAEERYERRRERFQPSSTFLSYSDVSDHDDGDN